MINLVVPMAGLGSRFSKAGYKFPKPLEDLHGKPFFWWSIQSVAREIKISSLTCVVLREHVETFDIDKKVLGYFPDAKFVILDELSDGALDSAMAGLKSCDNQEPILINDCDHAFEIKGLPEIVSRLSSGKVDGYLCHFKADSPAYSYAKYNKDSGLLEFTAEKEVISELAIAGLYMFRNKQIIESYFEEYKEKCTYNETFISGLYNFMAQDGMLIKGKQLESHLSFGTPEELTLAKRNLPYINWE
ncbi:NTP transferase domain-containing protein [Vibrio sp. McD22-P3]|uniref:NTP transferase domain-containing protein n=1 Tax=Vibrio sp. McD22-P3 TaxID=2724880 RepID=UPI001F2B11E7|nr:NTP transferase domain-containing protein [Vibrio sp. McD22-P3]MCF4175270.1 NTP transferase domain-containing protein [Vibrio sp. McD22-P3]